MFCSTATDAGSATKCLVRAQPRHLRRTADRINPLHTNPPDYTGAHRNTHVSTRPVVLFPAINTSEHRAGHVKQAHRFRWACFTLSYSPWSGSTGQGIKNPRAVFVVWGTTMEYTASPIRVPHRCTPLAT